MSAQKLKPTHTRYRPRISVRLLQDFPTLGRAGDVTTLSRGAARNWHTLLRNAVIQNVIPIPTKQQRKQNTQNNQFENRKIDVNSEKANLEKAYKEWFAQWKTHQESLRLEAKYKRIAKGQQPESKSQQKETQSKSSSKPAKTKSIT